MTSVLLIPRVCGRSRLSSRLGQAHHHAAASHVRRYTRPSIAPKPVLDIKHITKNPGLYEQNCIDRNYSRQSRFSWEILELTQKRAGIQQEARSKREENNALQKQIGELQRKIKSTTECTKNALLQTSLAEVLRGAKVLKDALAQAADDEKQIEDRILELALALPNLSSSHTGNGDMSETIQIVESEDERLRYTLRDHARCLNKEALSHVDIGLHLDILDFAGAARSSGWGWYFLKDEAAMLEQAMIQYTLTILRKSGFTITSPPSIVYSHIADACGFQPRDQNDEQQIYVLQQAEKDSAKPALSLAATAEIPLAGMYAGHTFKEQDLPLRMAAVSRCYRAEAGARGVDTKGLYRVHEFTKVEMFAWTMPPLEGADMFNTNDEEPQLQSDTIFHQMLSIQQQILTSLGLTFRILEMPSTDLGGPATRKRDMEVYFPSRASKDEGWGEVTSTSICTDYQSRRLDARVKSADGKLLWPYTINGTALAVPRILAAILETHYDTVTRSVEIPEVLRPWMDGIPCIKR